MAAVILPLLAIASVHAVHWGYFHWLHPGLKFPDLFPIMLAAIFLAWRFLIRRPVAELGVDFADTKGALREFVRGARYGAVVTGVCLAAALASGQVRFGPDMDLLRKTLYGLLPALGYLIFVPLSAFYEELHYRGLYLSVFPGRRAALLMAPVSAAVFSYIHLGVPHPRSYAALLFLNGMIWALMRLRTGSIFMPTGFHSAWNYILACLAPVFGDMTERYLEFTPIACWVLVFVFVREAVAFARGPSPTS